MSSLARHGADMLSTAVGIILGVSVLAGLYRGSAILPRLDAWMFPVIRIDGVTDITRDPHSAQLTTGRACFTLHLTKIRDALPIPYQFQVATSYSGQINVAAYLANADNSRARNQDYGRAHPAGSSWARRYCFELPGTISDEDGFTVTGSALHRRHPFWNTETPIPSFGVNPAGSR